MSSNNQLYLPDHQHQKSRQPRPLRNLVYNYTGKSLPHQLRDHKLTFPEIAPLFTNAFVYMVMGESS
jgi:hypothetical protein